MGQKIYYHNITKGIYNENCLTDAVDNYSKGDVIKFSQRGNALVFDIFNEDLSIESAGEFKHIRKEFLKQLNNYGI